MDDPKRSTTERQTDGDGLAAAVCGRILRLHPLAESNGMVNRLSSQGAGWDRAGVFADEIMGRFRSPAAVAASLMPLASLGGSAPKSASSAHRRSAAMMPALRPWQSLGTIPPRVVPRSETAPTGSRTSEPLVSKGLFIQRKVAVGRNPGLRDVLRSTAEGQTGTSFPDINFYNKKVDKTDSYLLMHDSKNEENVLPQMTATVRMNARLQDTLGPKLVQRHAGFAGAATADARGVFVSGETLPEPPARSSLLPLLSEQRKGAGFAQTGWGKVSSEATPVLPMASGGSGHVSMDKSDNVVGKSALPIHLRGTEPVKAEPGLMKSVPRVRIWADPLAVPLVKPGSPTGAGAIQRRSGGQPPLLFTRLQPTTNGAFGSQKPVALSVARVCDSETMPTGAVGTPSAAGLSGSGSLNSSPDPSPLVVRRSFSARGRLAVQPSVPPLVNVSAGRGLDLRKPPVTFVVPKTSLGEAVRVFPPVKASHGFPGLSQRRADSLPSPAMISSGEEQGQLPLVHLAGGMVQSPVVPAKDLDPGSAYPVSSGMIVQRTKEIGTSSAVPSSQSAAESAMESAATGQMGGRSKESSSGSATDVERLADQVYQIIERRLIAEKESRGL